MSSPTHVTHDTPGFLSNPIDFLGRICHYTDMTTNQITVTDYYTGKALSLPIRTVYTDREGYVCVVNPYTVHSFRVRESEASLRASL